MDNIIQVIEQAIEAQNNWLDANQKQKQHLAKLYERAIDNVNVSVNQIAGMNFTLYMDEIGCEYMVIKTEIYKERLKQMKFVYNAFCHEWWFEITETNYLYYLLRILAKE